jgi:hypothetical protein
MCQMLRSSHCAALLAGWADPTDCLAAAVLMLLLTPPIGAAGKGNGKQNRKRRYRQQ